MAVALVSLNAWTNSGSSPDGGQPRDAGGTDGAQVVGACGVLSSSTSRAPSWAWILTLLLAAWSRSRTSER